MVNYSRGASMITRYAPRNRQNDPQRNNPNPNPHDFRNHRLLLVLRDSEIPSNHTQSLGFNDRAIYGRHPNGFVRRILSTLAGAGNSRRTPVKRPTILQLSISRADQAMSVSGCDLPVHFGNVRFTPAGSTGRRNTGIKSLCWGFKLQGLTWSFV
jgi:hypothetical protein